MNQGKLLASGRASQIFDLGEGRVLRKFKVDGDPQQEALVMSYAAAHGFPVPKVFEVGDDFLVLERVEGPTMAREVARDQSTLHAHAHALAALHRQLHALAAPAGLPLLSAGGRLLHLDIHPGNVLLSPSGPVLLDWTNAASGDPPVDVALTWIIGMTTDGPLGRKFVEVFRGCFGESEFEPGLVAASQFRLSDPNVSDDERVAVLSLVAKQ